MNFHISPRAALAVIAAMFVLPIVLAWLMYSGTIEFRPGSTRNLGQLVEPPLPMKWDGVFVDGDMEAPAGDVFSSHWLILHAVPRPCTEACLRDIANLRQVHRAAGRQQARIRLALLHDLDDAESVARLQQIYASFRLLENPDGGLWHVLENVADQATPPAAARGSSYLIDPLGNIMMYYAAGSDPNDLNKDLKRLLTWSKLDE